MRLELTDVERLILANQYEILAALKKDDSYAQVAAHLRDGHEWLYSQDFQHISPNLPDDQAEHVIRIVGIYGDLKSSYERLPDKSGIDATLIRFPGFDGNNESELLAFADALAKAGKFSETLGRDATNSHHSTTDMYTRMIAAWLALGKPHFPYTKDQIRTILEARLHPGGR